MDCDPDLLERYTGVEKTFDNLQDKNVAERVETLCSRAFRAPNAAGYKAGAVPVVELPVGDTDNLAGNRSTVTLGLVQRLVLTEKRGLEELGMCGFVHHGLQFLSNFT